MIFNMYLLFLPTWDLWILFVQWLHKKIVHVWVDILWFLIILQLSSYQSFFYRFPKNNYSRSYARLKVWMIFKFWFFRSLKVVKDIKKKLLKVLETLAFLGISSKESFAFYLGSQVLTQNIIYIKINVMNNIMYLFPILYE